jgi:hypothetical protein
MHPYTVLVSDSLSKRQILSIPCAESQTAVLVQKNMESLFPNCSVQVQACQQEARVVLEFTSVSKNKTKDFAELEEDLFGDVA